MDPENDPVEDRVFLSNDGFESPCGPACRRVWVVRPPVLQKSTVVSTALQLDLETLQGPTKGPEVSNHKGSFGRRF